MVYLVVIYLLPLVAKYASHQRDTRGTRCPGLGVPDFLGRHLSVQNMLNLLACLLAILRIAHSFLPLRPYLFSQIKTIEMRSNSYDPVLFVQGGAQDPELGTQTIRRIRLTEVPIVRFL